MPLWLFRRRSRRDWNRPGSSKAPATPVLRSFTAPATADQTALAASLRRRSLLRKQRGKPNKLQRRERSYSFESGRVDSLVVSGRLDGRHPSPKGNAASSPPAVDLGRAPTLYHCNTAKRNGQELLPRTKSSKRRKNAHDREREAEIKAMSNSNVMFGGAYGSGSGNGGGVNDFVPLRPAAELGSSGRPVRREFTSLPGPRGAFVYGKEQMPSDFSLPITASIDSAVSDSDDGGGFVISTLAALAPKPTLRYASQPNGRVLPKRLPSRLKAPASTSRSWQLSVPIAEATIKAHKRVDDLANDMNASDLRELMERDTRRRERKRQRDGERTERRLAREAERQRREAALATGSSDEPASTVRSGPATAHLARGVLGRETDRLGIDTTTSAVVTSSRRRLSTPQQLPTPPLQDNEQEGPSRQLPLRESTSFVLAKENVSAANHPAGSSNASNTSVVRSQRRLSPVDLFHRPESISMESASLEHPFGAVNVPGTPERQQQPKPAIPARTDSRLRKLVKLRKRLSKSSSLADDLSTRSNGSGGALSWGSLGLLFRWRMRAKHGTGMAVTGSIPRADMASFSNVSRDSFLAQSSQQPSMQNQALAEQLRHSGAQASNSNVQLPSQVLSAPPLAVAKNTLKATSLAPKMAHSRFREDLPDFLLSPPASRSTSLDSGQRVSMSKDKSEEQLQQQQQQQKQSLYMTSWSRAPVPFDEDEEHYGRDDDSVLITPIAFHSHQQTAPVASSPYDECATTTSRGFESEHGQSQSQNHSHSHSGSCDAHGTPTSWLQTEDMGPSPEPQQSLSLASIDSEGSWLSGRAMKRRAPAATPTQQSLDGVSQSQSPILSLSQSQRHRSQQTQQSTSSVAPATAQEDQDMAGIVVDDEYMSRYAHNSTAASSRLDRSQCTSVADMRPSSDEEMDIDDVDDDESVLGTSRPIFVNDSNANEDGVVNGSHSARWGVVHEGHVAAAMVVPGRRTTHLVKSREGLLKTFLDGEEAEAETESPDENEEESPVSPVSQTSSQFKADEAQSVQRATSINLGRGHVRHISAGSAKLLDLTPRSSVDAKGQQTWI